MNNQSSDSNEVTSTGGGAYIKDGVNTGGGDFVGRDKVTIGTIINNLFASTPETASLLRARKILLENVNKFWVEGVLKRSLHNEVLLTIALEEKPSAVDNRPWDTVLQTPEQPDRPLPHGMKIIDVFDQQQQSLLILGTPGSGKTTMLLELARDLIIRAQQDITQPIPIVLNLSSWSVQRQPLADWIIAELNSKYYIAPKIAQAWVENDALLLLLDGLDEVQLEYQNACVDAINTFRKTYVVALAICSRIADYEALEQLLQLQSAVLIQPLSRAQIDEYFFRLSIEYTGVSTALRKDTVLKELAGSPLILSIMTLAYRGISVESLEPQRSTFAHRQYLFDTYIRRMFGRREPIQLYSPQQTLHWLTWLAQNIFQRRQTIFLIERLQPDCLQVRAQNLLYRSALGLVLGLVLGLLVGLFVRLVGGLSGALGGAIGGWLSVWLSGGLGEIKLTERIIFSWQTDKGLLVLGLVLGLFVWLILGLGGALASKLVYGLVLGLVLGLGGGILKREEASQHIQPNQGIWQSARNMCFGGLVFGPVGGLVFGLFVGLNGRPGGGLVFGLVFGLIFGLLMYGGIACIQHIVLRSLLTRYNYAPLNYAGFLDYCADRIFLRKVGGGYIFVHRLLLEHFAALTEEDIKRLSSSDPIA